MPFTVWDPQVIGATSWLMSMWTEGHLDFTGMYVDCFVRETSHPTLSVVFRVTSESQLRILIFMENIKVKPSVAEFEAACKRIVVSENMKRMLHLPTEVLNKWIHRVENEEFNDELDRVATMELPEASVEARSWVLAEVSSLKMLATAYRLEAHGTTSTETIAEEELQNKRYEYGANLRVDGKKFYNWRDTVLIKTTDLEAANKKNTAARSEGADAASKDFLFSPTSGLMQLNHMATCSNLHRLTGAFI
jgi:protein associated with RNAse G/E